MIGDCLTMINVVIQYLNNYDYDNWGPVTKASPTDAGIDLRSAQSEDLILLAPGERVLIPLGIKTLFDAGYEAQIRARSGLALKKGLAVVNGVGTIDAGYRNEWGAILINLGNEPIGIHRGDRIAQVVFNKLPDVSIVRGIVPDVDNRGGGFGHSGVS